jgi:hypothetical protein
MTCVGACGSRQISGVCAVSARQQVADESPTAIRPLQLQGGVVLRNGDADDGFRGVLPGRPPPRNPFRFLSAEVREVVLRKFNRTVAALDGVDR